eukprot:10940966-Lingulodinium_polyedra.AAC.1
MPGHRCPWLANASEAGRPDGTGCHQSASRQRRLPRPAGRPLRAPNQAWRTHPRAPNPRLAPWQGNCGAHANTDGAT